MHIAFELFDWENVTCELAHVAYFSASRDTKAEIYMSLE